MNLTRKAQLEILKKIHTKTVVNRITDDLENTFKYLLNDEDFDKSVLKENYDFLRKRL